MPYQNKLPPIKVCLGEDFYNLMIEVLVRNESVNVDSTDKYAKELKEKLLRYGIPYKTEEEKNAVNLRFYTREASEMIMQLLVFIVMNCDVELLTDYYSVLVKVREAKQQEKES